MCCAWHNHKIQIWSCKLFFSNIFHQWQRIIILFDVIVPQVEQRIPQRHRNIFQWRSVWIIHQLAEYSEYDFYFLTILKTNNCKWLDHKFDSRRTLNYVWNMRINRLQGGVKNHIKCKSIKYFAVKLLPMFRVVGICNSFRKNAHSTMEILRYSTKLLRIFELMPNSDALSTHLYVNVAWFSAVGCLFIPAVKKNS